MTIQRRGRGSADDGPTLRRSLVAVVATAALVAGCGGDSDDAVPPSEIGHVHDLVPDNDGLLVATHRGLLRLDDGSYHRVGDEVHDLMAMDRGPSGEIVASGHPDLRLERYRVDGEPSVLGLVRSSDEGETWEIAGLLGEVDFHAFAPFEGGFLAGDSTGSIWRFDGGDDGQPVSSIPFDINDLAVSPDEAAVVVATSYDGGFAVSDDAAQTWELQDAVAPITEIEWTDEGLLGATADGELWAAPSPAGPFARAGVVPGEVETLLVHDDAVWAATRGGQVYRRQGDDAWTPLVSTDN